jgi:DNA-binding NtrC family response regulator
MMATLLLVEDDRSVREMLDVLFSSSYECHTADRAEQALEFLEFQTYDAVITDISMPGLGGVEILRRMKEQHSTTPVIVVSGRADEYRESLIELGVFACFSKPFALDDLEDTVNQAIAHRAQAVSEECVQPVM